MALNIGIFQWKRHLVGTFIASDIFQRKLDSVYMGLPGDTGITNDMITVVMCEEQEVYSISCIGMLPFIEGSLGDGTSGLVAVSHDRRSNSEEHT